MMRTLVILTVTGIGKTWYKEHCGEGAPLVFDMKKYVKGQENDYSTKEEFEEAFKNIVFITRKLGLSAIIMANRNDSLVKLCTYNHIPYYAVAPARMYEYASKHGYEITAEISRMRTTATFKRLVNVDQHLSDIISKMWNDNNYHKQWETYYCN